VGTVRVPVRDGCSDWPLIHTPTMDGCNVLWMTPIRSACVVSISVVSLNWSVNVSGSRSAT
jgi:hypothetical protein